MCNAVIINNHWLLTARDCIDDDKQNEFKKNYKLRAGSDKTGKGGSLHSTDDFVAHIDYRSFSSDKINRNNIALIRVNVTIQFGPTRFPVRLSQADPVVGWTGDVTGFGDTLNDTCPKVMQSVKVTIVDGDACRGVYKSMGGVPENYFCGSGTNSDSGFNACFQDQVGSGFNACDRDRGAPYVIDGRLVGLAIYVHNCRSNLPVVYLDSSAFNDWIIRKSANVCNCTTDTNL